MANITSKKEQISNSTLISTNVANQLTKSYKSCTRGISDHSAQFSGPLNAMHSLSHRRISAFMSCFLVSSQFPNQRFSCKVSSLSLFPSQAALHTNLLPCFAGACTTADTNQTHELRGLSARSICITCQRPIRVCICTSLPSSPLHTQTRVLIIQHAKEAKRRYGRTQVRTMFMDWHRRKTNKSSVSRGNNNS